ncbi:hypothetical protein Tco_0617666 [Tanacetum coccineum]
MTLKPIRYSQGYSFPAGALPIHPEFLKGKCVRYGSALLSNRIGGEVLFPIDYYSVDFALTSFKVINGSLISGAPYGIMDFPKVVKGSIIYSGDELNLVAKGGDRCAWVATRFLAAVCLGFSKQLFALFMLCSAVCQSTFLSGLPKPLCGGLVKRFAAVCPNPSRQFDKMAEDNVPAPAPTRSDEYILPFNAWLPVGKVDILQNKNFFRAFTASANVPTINIQQFWNTLIQGAKTGVYSFQLDEHWFTLNADLLHEALEITPVDSTHPFESPSAGEQVMDFVNELGYPEEIYFVSKMHVSNLYQLWKAIMSLINQFLTGKTSGTDKPRHLVLQNIVGPAPTKQSALAKQTKPVKEKLSKPTPSKKFRKGKVMKVRKEKRSDHLIDEEDEEP